MDCKPGAGLYIFVNLINVGLNRRQLDSHLCFCIPSVVITMCVAPGKLHHTPIRQWESKSEIPSLYYEEHSLSLRDFLNRSRGPHGSLKDILRTTKLLQKQVLLKQKQRLLKRYMVFQRVSSERNTFPSILKGETCNRVYASSAHPHNACSSEWHMISHSEGRYTYIPYFP